MTPSPHIKATLKQLPDAPGVYLMKDSAGRVLYVGKAQSLRSRVRQYWQASRAAAPRPDRPRPPPTARSRPNRPNAPASPHAETLHHPRRIFA